MRLHDGYFWALTLIGSILLLDIGAIFWHPPAGFAAWDYLEWGLNATLVVVIWYKYRRQLQDLNKLSDRIDGKALGRLSTHAYSITFFAYIILLQCLASIHRH